MRIGALIVTFNRLKLLKKLLEKYEENSADIDVLLVVDNKSTDGTTEFLEKYKSNIKKFEVIFLTTNTGGSGGFYAGLKKLIEYDIDWIYLSDDDAYFEDSFFHIFKKRVSNKKIDEIACISSTVYNCGSIDINHRRKLQKKTLSIKEFPIAESYYIENSEFEVDLYSFVGIFLNKSKLTIETLPEKDYFIWYDDSEHSLKMKKLGRLICWPDLKVHHDQLSETNQKLTWKNYYGIRNNLLAVRKHFKARYFYYKVFNEILSAIFSLSKMNANIFMLKVTAIKDAFRNKQGLNTTYKPGWSAKGN